METTPPPNPATPPPTPSESRGDGWKNVIGIIAIIFGALALLQTVSAPLMLGVTRKSMEASITDEKGKEKLDAYMSELTSLSTMSSISLGIIAALLVVAGICLLRKKRIAAILFTAWAIVKIAAGCFFNYRNYLLMQTQFELLAPAGGAEGLGEAEAEMFNNITSISATLGLVGGVLWLLVFPVFVLIWFSRRKIKEQVRAW